MTAGAHSQHSAQVRRKTISTFKARCARVGWEIYATDHPSLFVARRWGRTRLLTGLEELLVFVDQLDGGQRAR